MEKWENLQIVLVSKYPFKLADAPHPFNEQFRLKSEERLICKTSPKN